MVPHAIESSQGMKHRDVLVMAGGTMSLLIAIVCNLFGAGLLLSAMPAFVLGVPVSAVSSPERDNS